MQPTTDVELVPVSYEDGSVVWQSAVDWVLTSDRVGLIIEMSHDEYCSMLNRVHKYILSSGLSVRPRASQSWKAREA